MKPVIKYSLATGYIVLHNDDTHEVYEVTSETIFAVCRYLQSTLRHQQGSASTSFIIDDTKYELKLQVSLVNPDKPKNVP